MFKKILSLILSLSVGITVIACGSKEKTDTKDKYVIATDTVFAPFEFTDEDGNFIGIDIDLMHAIAELEGFSVEFQALGFDASLLATDSEQVDGIIAGMTIREDRKEKYDFSDPYYDVYVTVVVSSTGDITDLEGLRGQTIATKAGTNGDTAAKALQDEYDLKLTTYDDTPDMLLAVSSGKAAACFEDAPVAEYNIKVLGYDLKTIHDITDQGSFNGFAVKKGTHADLLAKFNSGLKTLKENGGYQAIVDKYTK